MVSVPLVVIGPPFSPSPVADAGHRTRRPLTAQAHELPFHCST